MFWNRSDQWDLHGSKLFWHSPWKLHHFGIWVLKRPGGGFELSVTFLGTFLSSRWRVQLPWGGVLGIQQFLSWWYVLSSIHTNSMRQGFPSEDSILRWCSVFTSPHLLAFFLCWSLLECVAETIQPWWLFCEKWTPRRGIEPRSSAWQAEILSTILTRKAESQ